MQSIIIMSKCFLSNISEHLRVTTGIKPPTLPLVQSLLCLLRHSHPNQEVYVTLYRKQYSNEVLKHVKTLFLSYFNTRCVSSWGHFQRDSDTPLGSFYFTINNQEQKSSSPVQGHVFCPYFPFVFDFKFES